MGYISMTTSFKSLILFFCFSFCAGAFGQGNQLCTTSAITALIESKYGDDAKLKEIWTGLQDKNVVRIKDSDANVRPQVVKFQSLVESTIASLLKDGSIKYSRAVNYMPLPTTPLRADNVNLNMLVSKEFFDDKSRMQTITNRMTSTKAYLANKGVLYSVHQATAKAVPGSQVYQANLATFNGALVDKPITKIQGRYIGVSYIAECKDGSKVFFAIKGRQSNNTKDKTWSVYYGDVNNKKLNKTFVKLQERYSQDAGVQFKFEG